jgi:hypothetical protein
LNASRLLAAPGPFPPRSKQQEPPARLAADEPLRYLEMFRSPRFMDVSLNQWMALTPPELVQAHLNLDRHTMAALQKDKPIIVK